MGHFIYKHRRGTTDQWKGTGVNLYEGEIGVEYADEDQTKARILIGTKNGINILPFFPVVKIRTISLPADGWVGNNSPFSQVVKIDDVTKDSKVDLQLTTDILSYLFDEKISLTISNNSGVVTVYALNAKPEIDITIKVSITEVIIEWALYMEMQLVQMVE